MKKKNRKQNRPDGKSSFVEDQSARPEKALLSIRYTVENNKEEEEEEGEG